jgi:hypothetical protein
MTMTQFIRANRKGIDEIINNRLHGRDVPDPPPRYNDEERRLWILNDEDLYNAARREGVKI